MEIEQVREWAEAQKIEFSVDLVEVAKKQLRFLAAVDRNRCLYDGPALQLAVYRYNAFWLPLLAKHSENPVSDAPLVVPLDCEWVWHCHRLNPIRYKSDCEMLFGKILGSRNVISSVEATSKSKTEKIWNTMYPEEPYELDLNRTFAEDALRKISHDENFTSYDLVSAVKRQTSLFYQVSPPHISDERFLREAVARYKAFLHLVRTNRKNNIQRFSVPTIDVDLIWHSHQLRPLAYCKDMRKLVGKVLPHDDTETDKSKGSKLDIGFSETTKQWSETFGSSYWKAGGMSRGKAPAPVTETPYVRTFVAKKFDAAHETIMLPQIQPVKAVEVILEFVKIKNPPEGHRDNLFVSFHKKQPDRLFNIKETLSIFSKSGVKQTASFQCEPTGEFLFELVSGSPSSKSFKSLGSCSLSLQELVSSGSALWHEKWLTVVPVSGARTSEPILLHVSVSFTVPSLAPQVFKLLQCQSYAKVEHAKNQTHVIDAEGNIVFSLQMRDIIKDTKTSSPDLVKAVYCITDTGDRHTVAELLGNGWYIKGPHGSFKLSSHSGNDGLLFELLGHKMVKLFSGRRLDFQSKQGERQRSEEGFVTAVEFSADYPYGKAVGLIDIKSRIVKAMEEWIVLPVTTFAFLLSGKFFENGVEIVKIGPAGGQFHHYAKSCSVTSKGENGSMVKSDLCGTDCAACGDVNPPLSKGGYGGMAKSGRNGGDFAKCDDCGVLSKGEYRYLVTCAVGNGDCTKCYSCGFLSEGEYGGVVKRGRQSAECDGECDSGQCCIGCGGDNNVGANAIPCVACTMCLGA